MSHFCPSSSTFRNYPDSQHYLSTSSCASHPLDTLSPHTHISPISHSQATTIIVFELLQVLVPPKHSTRGPPKSIGCSLCRIETNHLRLLTKTSFFLHQSSTNHIRLILPATSLSVYLPLGHSRISSPSQPSSTRAYCLLLVAQLVLQLLVESKPLSAPARPYFSPPKSRLRDHRITSNKTLVVLLPWGKHQRSSSLPSGTNCLSRAGGKTNQQPVLNCFRSFVSGLSSRGTSVANINAVTGV